MPVTVNGDAPPLAVTVLGPTQRKVYDVMALPPLEAGATNATVACASPGVAIPMVGAPGTDALMLTLWVTRAAAA